MVKHLIILVVIVICAPFSFCASYNDSLSHCFIMIAECKSAIDSLGQENEKLRRGISVYNEIVTAQNAEIDSLKRECTAINQRSHTLADSLNLNISTTRSEIQTSSETLSQSIAKKSQTGLWIFIVLALAIAVVSFIFGRLIAKRGTEVATLSARADKLNEEIVNRMSSQISQMQTLANQIISSSKVIPATSASEQKLITTLADRITFMEMTLYKMDSSVRGHKQLSKSIKQMKDNLMANGYELVDMLGKDYHDGMKVTANFIEDESLPPGKQVITGIIKPQINYQGKMIQSAQITVSQNI